MLVTIRQCAESLSVRVGADHFLVSHHPGRSVVHLGDGGADGQRKRRNTAQDTKEHRLEHVLSCFCSSQMIMWICAHLDEATGLTNIYTFTATGLLKRNTTIWAT